MSELKYRQLWDRHNYGAGAWFDIDGFFKGLVELESQSKALAVEDMHDGERFGLVMECLVSMSYTDLKLITDKCIELERKHAQQLRDGKQ